MIFKNISFMKKINRVGFEPSPVLNLSLIDIYLKPKETLHFELSNIFLLLLSLTKLNIAMRC